MGRDVGFGIRVAGSMLLASVLTVGGAHAATDPVSTIVGVDAGLCLGVKGSTSTAGAQLQSQTCTGSDFQKWKFVKDSSGHFDLVNVGSGQCIDVTGGSTSNGTNMQQWHCSGAAYQKWNLTDRGSGQFSIVSKYNGLALDVFGASKANGASVVQWAWGGGSNQKWSFPSATLSTASGPTSGSVVTLNGVRAGGCLGVQDSGAGNGAKVKIQACTGSAFQQWKATKDSAGDFELVNVGSGMCMDIPGATATQGAEIQLWGCSGGAWQKWKFNNDNAGHYYITSKSNGLALDEDLRSNSAAVVQWAYLGGTNQQWVVKGGNAVPNNDVVVPGANQTGPIGFGAGTTGGAGGKVVTVTSAKDLAAALCATSSGGQCTDTTPRVIRISGVLDFRGAEGRKTELGCTYAANKCSVNGKTEQILDFGTYCSGKDKYDITYDFAGKTPLLVGSNKTLIGVGAASGIKGKGLALRGGVSNVIIRNLSITDINDGVIWAGDAITIDNASKVWIDHNYFARIGRQHIVAGWGTAQNVSISDNFFDGTTDHGHWCNGRAYWIMLLVAENQSITLSGNRIHNTSGRSPDVGKSSSVKNGGIVHLVNNYYDSNYFTGGLTGHDGVATLLEGNYYSKGDYFFPIMDTTANKTDTHSNQNFAPVAGNSATANKTCASVLGRNCAINHDTNGKDADFLLNPTTMATIQASSSAVKAIKSVTPEDASKIPNRKFGPQADIK